MRLGSVFVLLSLWLFAGTAAAMQVRLIDRSLQHPLTVQLPSNVLDGAGGDTSKTRTEVVVAQSMTSLVINGAALAAVFKVGQFVASENILLDFEAIGVMAALTGTVLLSTLLSPWAVALAASAFGEEPSIGRMIGWTAVARVGLFLVSMLSFEFFTTQNATLFWCAGTGLGIVAGGVLDVVLAQPTSSTPAAASRPLVSAVAVGPRTPSLPIVSMQF